MKKIVAFILALVLALSLVACGDPSNYHIGIGNYNWNHIHFSDAIEGHCGTVLSWCDDETGIEVNTAEYRSMFLSEGSYILFEDSSLCPYCH